MVENLPEDRSKENIQRIFSEVGKYDFFLSLCYNPTIMVDCNFLCVLCILKCSIKKISIYDPCAEGSQRSRKQNMISRKVGNQILCMLKLLFWWFLQQMLTRQTSRKISKLDTWSFCGFSQLAWLGPAQLASVNAGGVEKKILTCHILTKKSRGCIVFHSPWEIRFGLFRIIVRYAWPFRNYQSSWRTEASYILM